MVELELETRGLPPNIHDGPNTFTFMKKNLEINYV